MGKGTTAKMKTLRTCKNGHQYYKSSDCPICPLCDAAMKPKEGFMLLLSAPARRALENAGIATLQQLSIYTEKEILQLHGVGKTTMPVLQQVLKKAGLDFKE